MDQTDNIRSGQRPLLEISTLPKHTSTDLSHPTNLAMDQETETSFNSSKYLTTQRSQWDGNRPLPLMYVLFDLVKYGADRTESM